MNSNTKASYKLPAEAYFDQSWLDKEKLNIFAGSWLFAGLASALPDPGHYKTFSAGFDDLIKVFLECPLLVTDEAEDMVQREPLDVGRVLVKISADTVQFGEEFF